MNKFPTLWRFLLPLLILLVLALGMLTREQISRQMTGIKQDASNQARSLARLLNITESLVNDQVNSSMRLLKEREASLGEPTITGTIRVNGSSIPNLKMGDTPQSNRFEMLDSVTELLGGTATLFAKSGDSFVRVSTNVRTTDGSRAIGTLLDPHGKAIAAIRQGHSFNGVVDILGEPYITRYEPMRNASGEIVGIYYVGYKVDMRVTREAVEKSRFLRTGFAAVLDDKNHTHFISRHAPQYAAHILEKTPSNWIVVREEMPTWGFKVLIAYPIGEAHAAGLGNSLLVIGSGVLLGLLIIAIILWQLRRFVLNPIGGDPSAAIELVQRIKAGNLEEDGLHAKDGTLMANLLRMRKKLREMVHTLNQNAERMSLSANVFVHTHDGIFIADRETRIIDVNPAFSKLTGFAREEALSRTPQELGFALRDEKFFQQLWQNSATANEWRGETCCQRKNGEIYTAWLDLFIVRDDQERISHYCGIFSDITPTKEYQQKLEQLAYHDPLTQLPNRTLLADRLQQSLARAARSKELLAICYFDLDDFKPVNDQFGHEAGDQLLVQLAQRIRTCLRESDTIARLGGDEFAVLLCGLNTVNECWHTLDRLLAAINTPFDIDGNAVRVSASIGYTLFPQDDSTPDTLLRHADHAMYQAKINGGSGYHLFDAAEDRLSYNRRQELENIEAALAKGEFCLHYQPKVDMRRGKVIGMEALARWQHPELGLRSPIDFLPLIEETEFIIPFGEWVILEALAQMQQWQEKNLLMKVSVNIAARHMTQPDFADRLAILLQQFPMVSPKQLELEITETAAIADIAGVAEIITNCKRLGVTFALDDFGVGYSSLTYLRRLPVEVLKIDQSFVRDMLHDNEDMILVAGVISLSREFLRHVIAEGVETAEHGLHLLRMGCELGQGHGISPPMPSIDVPQWVASYLPAAHWTEYHLAPAGGMTRALA